MTPKNKETAQSTSHRKLLSYYGLWRTVPLAILFLIQSIFFKTQELTQLKQSFSGITVAQTIGPDMAFALSFCLIFAVLFSHSKGPLKAVVSTIFHVGFFLALLLNAASHGYFSATGSHLSWALIDYWFHNMAITNKVASSETAPWKLILLFVQVMLTLVSAIWPELGALRRRLRRISGPGFRVGAAIFTVIFISALVGIFLPSPKGSAMSLARCIPMAIIGDCLHDLFTIQSKVEILADEQFGSEVSFNQRADAPRPNIVFILFESLNWKNSDVYNPGIGTTPFLAKLAKKSIVVENSYTTIPHTTKAVMSALCGLYPYFKTTPKETITGILPRKCMAHILRDHGYKTAFFQPARNFEKRNQLVANMGFEVYKGYKDMPVKGFEKVSYFGAEDMQMLKPSMDWVDTISKIPQPFFLTYLTLATHHNYVVPQSFPWKDFPGEDPDKVNFMNSARYVDHFIEQVFAQFEERGLMDNTVFIISGDHGEGFAEHGRRQHDLVIWEEGLRTTSLLHGPKFLPKTNRITGFRSHLDWVPTVCDILGLEPTEGSFVGSSMLQPVPKRQLFHSCWFSRQCMALREGPIKTIFFYNQREMEVYDNLKDPYDEHNLAFKDGYDQTFLDKKREEMLRFEKVVSQQFSDWEKSISQGKVTDEEPSIANKLHAKLGNAIEFVGYEADPKNVIAGSDINLKYVFKCVKKPDPGDKLFVHGLGKGRRFVNGDHIPVSGTHPARNWEPGQYIVDEHTIHVPGDWPNGEIHIGVGFWNTGTKKRLTVSETDSADSNNRLIVAKIPVRAIASKGGFTREELREKIKDWVGFDKPEFKTPVGVTFNDSIELVGVNLRRTDVELAGTVELTYVFRVIKSVPADWKLEVRLSQVGGSAEIKADHVPISGLYPPHYWRPGEYIVDRHRIHIDMYRSKIGTYRAHVGFKTGKNPTAVSGSGDFDSKNRVDIGEVFIRKDNDPHLRR